MDQKKIGGFLAQLRKEQEMTQEGLAEKLGVSNRSVSRWENGNSMPDLSLLPVIGEVLGVSVTELLNGERAENEGNQKENILLLIRLSEEEKRRKAKKVNGCFMAGLLCLGIAAGHGYLGILNFAKEPGLLWGSLVFLGAIFEIAGFACNSRQKNYSEKEIAILSNPTGSVSMRTAAEMLQFARKSQKADLPQYQKAFQAIAEKLEPGENAVFSMVADTFVVNESWTDSWRPWHVAIAVTEQRLLVCGEAIHGRFMTFYDVESYALEEISSIRPENRKIIIEMKKGTLTIEGKDLEKIAEALKRNCD